MSPIPYADALGGRDPLAVMAATPAALEPLVERALAKFGPDAPLAQGKWSLRQVMAHLADCEVAWGWRLRQAYGSDHAVLQPFDQDAWAKIYPTTYTLEEARALYAPLRAWNVAFLRGLSATERNRAVTHPERGEETLWTIAEIAAGHDLHHLAILERQVKA